LTVLAKLLRPLLLDNHTGNRRRTLKNFKNFLHSFSVTSPHKIFLVHERFSRTFHFSFVMFKLELSKVRSSFLRIFPEFEGPAEG
jgi:hypothetical protein